MKVLMNTTMRQLQGTTDEEFVFLTKETQQKFENNFDVIYNMGDSQFSKEELIEKISDVDAVITHWFSTRIDEDVLKAAKNLKIIGHLCGTVKPYICEAVYDRDIKVISGNDLLFAQSVAESALAYALVSLRKIDDDIMKMRTYNQDGWGMKDTKIRGLLCRTVGLVSFGAVAKHFAKMLSVFGCKVKAYSIDMTEEEMKKYNVEMASLEEIFSTCDVISVHTAYNQHTHHYIDKHLLSMIKENALFINTARGGVVDEEALADELSKNRFYAALDVFEQEPPPADSKLYGLSNCLMFPHRGGPTPDLYKHITSKILDDVTNYLLKGEVPDSEISKERAFNMSSN